MLFRSLLERLYQLGPDVQALSVASTLVVAGLIEEGHVRAALEAVSDIGPVTVSHLGVDELAAASPIEASEPRIGMTLSNSPSSATAAATPICSRL